MAPSSRDPFFIVKDEIDESLVQLERSHARWDTLPDGNAERVALSNDLQGSCESLSWQKRAPQHLSRLLKQQTYALLPF